MAGDDAEGADDADGANDAAGAAPVLSVILVSYETREMTLACLESIAAETRTPHEVILWDNASTDGSADAIAAGHPGVRLIRSAENVGFGRANNLAAREARGRWLLLLNPDTVVLDGALDRLVTAAERDPSPRIWGGRTIFADGSVNPLNAHGQPGLWTIACFAFGLSALAPGSRWLNPQAQGQHLGSSGGRVDVVTGCLFMIARADWERLGGFDPDFHMYGEEFDLCHRARALGARPEIVPDAVIIHHGGASEPVRADRIVRVFTAKLTHARKHWSPVGRWAAQALYRFAVLWRAGAYGVAARLSGRPGHRKAAAEWAGAWRARANWLAGYPPAPPGYR